MTSPTWITCAIRQLLCTCSRNEICCTYRGSQRKIVIRAIHTTAEMASQRQRQDRIDQT
jgi:hypothetical protein